MNDIAKYLLSNIAALLLAVLASSSPALAAMVAAAARPLAALGTKHLQALCPQFRTQDIARADCKENVLEAQSYKRR